MPNIFAFGLIVHQKIFKQVGLNSSPGILELKPFN